MCDPTAAFAQDETATRARTAFDRGTRRFQTRRYDQALEAFEEAYSITPHPAVLFNIASCYDKLGRAAEAVNAYHRYMRERGDDVEPARRRDVTTALTRLSRQVALLQIVPPAPGLPVMLDGLGVEIGADPIAVAPGVHIVSSTAPDGREAREEISAVAGETGEVALELPAPPTDPERGNGDGQSNGGDGNAHELPPPPPPSRGWSPTLRWVGVGATVAFAAGWAFTGVQALTLNSDYEQNPDRDTRDTGLTYRALADFVFMPATILAAGFTVLAFVLARADSEASPDASSLQPPTVGPWLAADGAGLWIRDRF